MVLPYDDSIIDPMDEATLTAYEGDDANYSIVAWRVKANPKNHWCVPFVASKTEFKKYYVRWAHGLDFEKMTFAIISWLWEMDEVI